MGRIIITITAITAIPRELSLIKPEIPCGAVPPVTVCAISAIITPQFLLEAFPKSDILEMFH
jgi:hypothetical protein